MSCGPKTHLKTYRRFDPWILSALVKLHSFYSPILDIYIYHPYFGDLVDVLTMVMHEEDNDSSSDENIDYKAQYKTLKKKLKSLITVS